MTMKKRPALVSRAVCALALALGAYSYNAMAAMPLTPAEWPSYALTAQHNAYFASRFPAVSWRFEAPGARELAHSFVKNPTVARDIVGFPIGVAVVDNVVYAPNDNGYLYALNARTSRLLWKFNAYNQIMTTPIVATVRDVRTVYVGGGNSVFAYSHAKLFGKPGEAVVRGNGVSGIFALDAVNGKMRWFYPTKGEDMPTPVLFNGKLIFGNGDGHVYALDAADGRLLWKTAIGSFVSMSSAVIDAQDGIVTMGGTHPSRVYGLDANTGKLLWAVTPDNVFSSSAGDGTWAVDNGVAIGQIEARPAGQAAGTSSAHEIAIDMKSGKVLWTADLGAGKIPPRNKVAVPAIVDGVVYTGSPVTHTEYAINAKDGSIRWKQPLKAGMKCAPTVVGERVIQPTAKGKIFALDRASGKVTHVYQSRDGGYGPQNGVAIGGTFFIGTNLGVLQAIPLRDLHG